MIIYKNITDLLGEGKHRIKVMKADRYDKNSGQFVKGEQQTVPTENGRIAYKYNIESVIVNGVEKPLRYDNGEGKEYRCSILAFNNETKSILDSGEAEINIVPKKTKEGKEIFVREGDEFVKKLTYFINKIPKAGIPRGDQNVAENRLFKPSVEYKKPADEIYNEYGEYEKEWEDYYEEENRKNLEDTCF